MIDFNNNIYLGVASPDMERDLSNYYTKAQTRALVDTKQDIITGAATTITEDNLTANRAVISNGSGKVAVSNVTSTELGYLSGVTSGVQTQLNNKASTSLDNLTADGQMIIDSQNGTISNCVLDIPQNIKLTLENNVLTLKAGSVLTLTGSTYATVTRATDLVRDHIILSANTKFVFWVSKTATSFGWSSINRIGSGSELPVDGSTYYYFFLTTDKNYYHWENNNWVVTEYTYPLCVIESDSSSNLSFAKDSNGNDMIFNGAGFIGHHAFVYPNVKALIPDGFNDDGSMKSISVARSALTIREILGSQYFSIGSATAINPRPSYFEVNTLDDLYAKNIQGFYYVKSINQCYSWGGGSGVLYAGNFVFIHVNISGKIVTDFTIRQPVRMATVEMLNSALGDVETLLATV